MLCSSDPVEQSWIRSSGHQMQLDSMVSYPSQLSQSIRCTFPKCSCDCFMPLKNELRSCQNCRHGWVAHALDKLVTTNIYAGLTGQSENITPALAFDIASLILYGCQAIPIRLKIALDRLFSVLQHDEVLQILHGFGWSYEDYARAYILQDSAGRVLEKWSMLSREEEGVVLQQFTHFTATQTVVQNLLNTDSRSSQSNNIDSSQQQSNQSKSQDSDIRKFIERSNLTLMQSYNLALRRAIESQQTIFSGFPPHISMAAAAAAAQFNRVLPQPGSGMMSAGFPAVPKLPKAEPVTKAEQILSSMNIERAGRSTSEPCDLSKPSPESHTASPNSHSPNSNTAQNPISISQLAQSLPDNRNTLASSSPNVNLMRPQAPRSNSPPGKTSGWPFNNPAFGQTVFVTPSGKKRVLCTACNKTFCDKGALKIHYSAVHLKEMHKCTIPGCNMMFSSRRSRNRHSANPNPKLHTPQTRRPRERYDSSQPGMMGLIGMTPGSSRADGEQSTVSESSDQMMTALPEHYQVLDDESLDGSDPEDDHVEVEMDDSLPTQVPVKADGPLYRSNKRKRLMPTRVTSETDLNISEENQNVGVIPSDPMAGGDGIFLNKSVDSSPEPGEVCRNGLESGEREDNSSINNSTNSGDGMSIFSNHEGQSSFWSKLIQKTAQMSSIHQTNEEKLKLLSEVPVDSENPRRCMECGEMFPNTYSLKLHYSDEHLSEKKPETQADPAMSECLFCDKKFPSHDALTKHVTTVHQGQQNTYNEPSFNGASIDSLNRKPVLSA